MKRRLYLIILFVAVALSGMAQNIGEAFYIYRNDGEFNAFFCEDIISIEYSYEDANGNTYDELVTQIVNTVDGCYKIPLAAIDSVAFRVNDIRVSPDYLPVDEEGYTIVSADVESGQYVLRFSGTVPSIETGKVMTVIGEEVAELIRVTSVQCSGQQVSISAEPASLGDVFAGGSFTLSTEQEVPTRAQSISQDGGHVFYPVEMSFYDDDNRLHRIKRGSPHSIDFEHNLYNYTLDYSGHEFYSNNYMKLYLQTCRLEFNLDLIISCNFNSFTEGVDKWRKGELAVEKAVVRGKVDTDLMLRFDAFGKKEEQLDEIMLKKNMHKPIIAKFIVSGVPIVVVLNTHLLADGNYDVEGNFSAYMGFATSTSAELGCSWAQASGLKPYASFNNSFTLHDPTIEGSAHLDEKISVFPRVTFSLYGLMGPSFDIKPYLRQSFDLGFYDDLIESTSQDFYGAEYNLFTGYDAAVGLSYLSVIGNEPFVKSPSWNVVEAHLYKAPESIKFETASSKKIVAGKPIEASFRVQDILPAFNLKVNPAFPLTVKFETNSGTLSSDFSCVDINTGLAKITWTPAGQSINGQDPYLLAMMHDHNGQIIAADRWKPEIEGNVSFCPDSNHPHLIDLGLPSGTKWACCNVGASKPEDPGGYYAWGETTEKEYYSWSNYVHLNSSSNGFFNLGFDISGSPYDVAHALWGDKWEMPTHEQQEELYNYCTSEKTTINGLFGFIVHGLNGSALFLPASGGHIDDLIDRGITQFGISGWYWSSTQSDNPLDAHTMDILDGYGLYTIHSNYRYFGFSVRPIQPGIKVITGDATNTTSSSVSLNGKVENLDKAKEGVKLAFLYSTDQDILNSTGGKTVVVTPDGEGNMTVNISDLSDYTTYYYAAAYKLGNADYVLGEVKSFRTNSMVTTIENPEVTVVSATLQGTCSKGINITGFSIKKEGDTEYTQYSAEVDGEGNFSTTIDGLDLETKYFYYAFVQVNGITYKGAEYSFTTKPLCPNDKHPHMIDLGLPSGTKWSCCNVGATKPEEYGGYYAWGETSEKDSYTIETYQHTYIDNQNGIWVNIDTGDYLGVLDLGSDIAGTQYDAANVIWGNQWQMPSKTQIKELREYCTAVWVSGRGSLRLDGPSGYSILLPDAGNNGNGGNLWGFYWSSSASGDSDNQWAYQLSFWKMGNEFNLDADRPRYMGASIRPIRK